MARINKAGPGIWSWLVAGIVFAGVVVVIVARLHLLAGLPSRAMLDHTAAEVVMVNATEWLVVATALAALATFAAVVVALVGYFIGDRYRRRDRVEADIAAAQLIGLKLFEISNSTADLHKHLWLDAEGSRLEPDEGGWLWQKVFPLVGLELDSRTELNGEEMGLLVRIGRVEFLVEHALAAKRLRGVIRSLDVYRQQREDIQRMLPPPVAVEGARGTHHLTLQQALQVAPHAQGLDKLLQSVRAIIQENSEKTGRLSEEFYPMMKAAFPEQKFIQLKALPPVYAPPRHPAA